MVVELLVVTLIVTVAMLALLLIYIKRFVRVPPNKALVIFGGEPHRGVGRGNTLRIVVGRGVFIPPVVKDYAFLPLEVKRVELNLEGVKTAGLADAPRFSIHAIALVKVSSETQSLQRAAEALLGKGDEELVRIAHPILETQLRRACSVLPWEALFSDLEKVSSTAAQGATAELMKVGLECRSLSLPTVEGLARYARQSMTKDEMDAKYGAAERSFQETQSKFDQLENRIAAVERSMGIQ
jgi:flotillin